MTKTKNSKQEDYRLICPRCGSDYVEKDLSKDMIAWGGSTRYLCKNCDFSSPFFPEVTKSELKKYRSSIKNRTPEQKMVVGNQTGSKGFENKKVNAALGLFQVTIVLIAVLLFIINGLKYFEGRYVFVIVLVPLLILFGFWYENRSRNNS